MLACLAKNPAARPASAAALGEALTALDVGRWSARDARAWWDEDGAAVRKHGRAEGATSSEITATVAVDFRDRL